MPPDAASVLVVDDEERFAEAHARMLRDEYDVEVAFGGEQALAVVDESFDALVLDRKMPGCDGDEVVSRVRERGVDCRVVMLTAVEPDFDIIEMGIDDYLTKPTTEAELKETVGEVLEWAEYDEALRDYFALSNKRDVLIEEKDTVTETDRFTEIERRLKEKAQEGLQKNREVLETLIQSSPAAIVTLDPEGKVDIWNPSAEDVFGWTSEEVMGEHPPMFTTDALEELERIRASLFADAVVTDVDVECVRKSGSPLDVSLSAAPLYDSEGEMYGTMFVMMDITERKRREQRLNVLSRVLRHNLRNDLNVIIGRAKVIREDMCEQNRAHMDKMIDVGEQLLQVSEKARTVQNLLERDGNDVVERDLREVVQQTTERAREAYPNAEVTVDVRTGRTDVLASEGLRVAVWNLVENAVEHSDAARPTVEVTVDADSNQNPGWTTVTVADDGPGIQAHEVEVIEQGVEEVLKHGSGIGLWIVKWMVDRSGGELEFTDSELGGTAVVVHLRDADHSVSP